MKRLRLVIGGSLGGMQVLEWALLVPRAGRRRSRRSPSPARHSAWAIALSETQRQAIAADPRWRGGHYPAEDPPAAGLAAARMVAMCSYRSRASLEARFGRERARRRPLRGRELAPPPRPRARGPLRRQQLRHADAGRWTRTTSAAAGAAGARRSRPSTAPALVVSIDSDVLYPPVEQEELAAALPDARLVTLRSPHGHDAFLIEGEAVGALVKDFRDDARGARSARASERRHRGWREAEGPEVRRDVGRLAGAARARPSASWSGRSPRRPWSSWSRRSRASPTRSRPRSPAPRPGGSTRAHFASALRERHLALLRAVASGRAATRATTEIVARLAALEELLRGVAVNGRSSAAERAWVLADGRAALRPDRGRRPALARPRGHGVRRRGPGAHRRGLERGEPSTSPPRDVSWSAALGALPKASLPVVTGFIGGTEHGETTLLGRGGSDYTAAVLGWALEAERVEIWSDVPGVMSGDPRRDASARTLPRLGYGEAAALARAGAKVLHPRTLEPLEPLGIPLFVGSTLDPGGPARGLAARQRTGRSARSRRNCRLETSRRGASRPDRRAVSIAGSVPAIGQPVAPRCMDCTHLDRRAVAAAHR